MTTARSGDCGLESTASGLEKRQEAATCASDDVVESSAAPKEKDRIPQFYKHVRLHCSR